MAKTTIPTKTTGSKLTSGEFNQLIAVVNFNADLMTSSFDSTVLQDGDTLPEHETPAWLFVGIGTFNKPEGGTIVTTLPVNIVGTDGTSYSLLLSSDMDGDYITETETNALYINKNLLLDPVAANLAVITPGLYYNSITGAQVASAVYTGFQKIACVPGDVFVIQGVTAIPSYNTLRIYDSSDVLIGTLLSPNIYTVIEGGLRLTIPLTPSNIAKFGLFFENATSAQVVSIQKRSTIQTEDTRLILTEKIPPFDVSLLNNDVNYQSEADLFDAALPNLITTYYPGYIYSSTGVLTVNAAFNTFNKIPTSGKTFIAVSGLTGAPTSPNVGRFLRADGTVFSTITAASMQVVDGGYVVSINSDPLVTHVVLFFDLSISTDYTKILIQESDEVSYPKIKDKYLTTSDTTEDESLAKALKYYDIGNVPKVYNSTKPPGFLMAGQSNQAGRIVLSELPSYWTSNGNKLTDVQILNNPSLTVMHDYDSTDYETISSVQYFSYEIMLLKMISDHRKIGNPTAKIYAIKRAVGSTAISLNVSSPAGVWNADYEQIPSAEKLLSTLEKMKAAYEAANQPLLFDLKAFIWHQGEADKPDADNYYQNLKNVIWYVRGMCNNPKLHIYLGGINALSDSYSLKVEQAKQQLAAEDLFTKYIPVSNTLANLKSDHLHFNYAGGLELATNMYNQMLTDGII